MLELATLGLFDRGKNAARHVLKDPVALCALCALELLFELDFFVKAFEH